MQVSTIAQHALIDTMTHRLFFKKGRGSDPAISVDDMPFVKLLGVQHAVAVIPVIIAYRGIPLIGSVSDVDAS